MDIIRGLENVEPQPNGSLTVGSFDGIHLGHQRILRKMNQSGFKPVTVMTFDPHPQSVVRPNEAAPPLLTGFEERVELFKRMKVDRLIFAKFDLNFAKLTPEQFVVDKLVGNVGMKSIFVGPRHGFGAGRRGNSDLLRRMGTEFGFTVNVVEPVIRDDGFISSSRIRRLLLNGDPQSAMRYLSRPFLIVGKVVVGDKRGRELGFPTANIGEVNPVRLLPHSGIYTTVTEVDGVRYRSVSHIGERPTFPGSLPSIETHILDFENDIYHKTIRLGLVDFLRPIEAFDSVKALVDQMIRDRDKAVETLKQLGFGENARLKHKRIGTIKA